MRTANKSQTIASIVVFGFDIFHAMKIDKAFVSRSIWCFVMFAMQAKISVDSYETMTDCRKRERAGEKKTIATLEMKVLFSENRFHHRTE